MMLEIFSINKVKYAIDTDILVYAYDKLDYNMSETAINLIRPEAFLSNYVFQEFLFQLKIRKLPKQEILKIGVGLLDILNLNKVGKDTYRYAYHLVLKHDFQASDSIIIADAILNNCNILYSRDMQNGQIVDKKLKVVNPFKESIK